MCSILTIVLEFALLRCLTAVGVDARPVALITLLIVVFSAAYFVDIWRGPKLRPYSLPLFLGYVWRVALLYFDYFGKSIYNLPNSGVDSEGFFRTAIQVAAGNSQDKFSFAVLMGNIMKLTGVSRLYAQFIVLLFSIVALVFAARTLEYVAAPQKTRYNCMMVLCLLPNFAILSSIFLRESVVAMFLAISFYCFVRWLRGGHELSFWLAFVFVFCGAAFHSGSVGAAMGYVVVRLLYDRGKRQFRFTWKSLLPAIFFALVFAFLYLNYADVLFSKMGGISSVEDIAGDVGYGGSTYVQYVGNSATPLNMLIYTIPRMVYFLFSPFPWQWRGLSDIIAFCFSSMFYLLALVRAVRYLKSRQPENRTLVIGLLIVALCLLFIFGWGTSNVGTATRHREKAIILYGILLCCSGGVKGRCADK